MAVGVYVFGAGVAIARVKDSAGNVQAIQIPTLKEVTVKFDGKLESQFGGNVYAEDAATGERKITGTIKMGQVEANMLNLLIFGGTTTAGTPKVVLNEGGLAGQAPVSNVVTAVNNTGATVDMGVVSAVSGKPFTRVASVTANGQYSFDGTATNGKWTFHASDPDAAFVRPSYRWVDTSVGLTIELGNPLQGTLADLELTLWKPRFSAEFGIILYHAVLNGLDLSSKQGAYTDPSATFECFIDQIAQSPGQMFDSVGLAA